MKTDWKLETVYFLVSFAGASYIRRFLIDHAGASAALSVCVRRTNVARAGAKEMMVRGPAPLPSTTGLPHVVPSADTCTV
jgi:hypothetical protein